MDAAPMNVDVVDDDNDTNHNGMADNEDAHEEEEEEEEDDNPPQVTLTSEERQLAKAVKEAIENSDHVEDLPDFDYVQLALGCHGDIQKAVEAAYKLQCLREMYNIQETVEDGMDAIRGFMQLQPGALIEICYLPLEQTYWVFFDYAKFQPSLVRTERDWKYHQAGLYYMFRAVCSRLSALKTGTIVIMECEGTTFQNVDMAFEERAFQELKGYYPMRYKDVFFLHPPMAWVVFMGMMKRFCSNKQLESVQVGASFNGYDGRVDGLFKLPTTEIAEERLRDRLKEYLEVRYRNEREFFL